MRRLISLGIIIGGIILIISTMGAVVGLWGAGGKVGVREKEIEVLEKENTRLRGELKRMESPEQVEEMARNKLNLVKPGETVVVIPAELMATGAGEAKDLRPNWKRWWELVF